MTEGLDTFGATKKMRIVRSVRLRMEKELFERLKLASSVMLGILTINVHFISVPDESFSMKPIACNS